MTMLKLSRVRDIVLSMLPAMQRSMPPEEMALAPHIRGNERLYEALVALITARIRVRDTQSVPSDPIDCRGILERNYELRWLLSRLDAIYRSPVNPQAADGDPASE